jgi:hypothetical protein
MCLGIMPSSKIYELYGFKEYYDLGNAVINGDIKTFEEVQYI